MYLTVTQKRKRRTIHKQRREHTDTHIEQQQYRTIKKYSKFSFSIKFLFCSFPNRSTRTHIHEILNIHTYFARNICVDKLTNDLHMHTYRLFSTCVLYCLLFFCNAFCRCLVLCLNVGFSVSYRYKRITYIVCMLYTNDK